jgi:hypothetical protein
METNLKVIVSLFIAALGGGNVLHVVIIVLLGFDFSPKWVIGVVSNCSRVVSVTWRARRGMRGTHFGYLVSKTSRWREERFKDAIEWATGALVA